MFGFFGFFEFSWALVESLNSLSGALLGFLALSWGSLGALLGVSLALLGFSWGSLGLPWALFGLSWGSLGALLGFFLFSLQDVVAVPCSRAGRCLYTCYGPSS